MNMTVVLKAVATPRFPESVSDSDPASGFPHWSASGLSTWVDEENFVSTPSLPNYQSCTRTSSARHLRCIVAIFGVAASQREPLLNAELMSTVLWLKGNRKGTGLSIHIYLHFFPLSALSVALARQ